MQLYEIFCNDDQRDRLLQLLATSVALQQPAEPSEGPLAQDLLLEAFQLIADAPAVTLLADCAMQSKDTKIIEEHAPLPAEDESQSVVAMLFTQPESTLSPRLSEELYRVCAESGVILLVHGPSSSPLLRGHTSIRQMHVVERQIPASDARSLLAISDSQSEETAYTVLICCKKHMPTTADGFQGAFESRLDSWSNVVVPDMPHMNEEELKVEHTPAVTEPVPRVSRVPAYARCDASIVDDPPFVEFDSESESTPAYYDWRKYYPQLQLLLDHVPDLLEEALNISNWVDWPEQHYSDGGSKNWKVVPFVYTFPAYDPSKTTWVEPNCERCPNTAALLKQIPNIRTALFSRLGPASRISAHTGWEDLANYVLRCHVSLKIPPGNTCGLWVDGEVRMHRPNSILVFDDSKLHRAFNESDEDRLVLILDMARPDDIPRGEAKGGHTMELDNLIQLFS